MSERAAMTYETVHECRPPGWWRRRKLGVRYGDVWRCVCGELWVWSGYENGSWWSKKP